ncbi:RluA family pseudouridine synthase [Ornithinibacillus halotolerans]|uniref:Pseudouridine synthase n=1 Tax=Ornithinibacillus halotolerans TaxID=1274357 RepID=A0A916W740_9BACI|nr:RluA family pseudouridine synthase [Ornithinibacillus halotolerans]GGA74128.1 pseudouridine synthase [Ornithinibacillus halotolerans]
MKWTIQEVHTGMILRDYLRNEQGFSRRILKSLIYDGGKICVNDKEENLRYVLQTGDTISLEFPLEIKGNHMKAENVPIEIVYEDNDVLVINKQAGVATIPSLHHPSGTIANGVLYHYEQHHIPYTIHVVTRLDRDTSGLLLIAKHRYSHSILSKAQKAGQVKRTYYAVIQGVLANLKGTIDENIGRKEDSIVERMVRSDGQRAITHYEVMKDNSIHSLVKVQLETGRTHQIRVHFSYIGHPLAGDDLYGGKKDVIYRQALHCYQLEFEHPLTKKRLVFASRLPEDMKKILPDELV